MMFRVTVSQGDVNKNLYYVLLAADSEGNIGQMGNIVKAYMPRCFPSNDLSKTNFNLFSVAGLFWLAMQGTTPPFERGFLTQ